MTADLSAPMKAQTGDREKLTVLVCEASGVQRQILTQRLEDEGFTVIGASSGTEALALVDAGFCDILITGVELADFSGFELCWRVKADPTAAHIQTMVLSSIGDQKRLSAALDSGADDFLRKPLEAVEFRARLRAAARIVRLQRRLMDEASNDALTGVMNRRSILRALERELDACQRTGAALHLAMVDLDRFKSINDTYGHAAGDAVLVQVSALARDFIRRGELFGRLGGEEFVLVLPDTTLELAQQRADNLRAQIEAQLIPTGAAEPLRVTASLGLAGATAETGDYNTDVLLERADTALYAAKRGGRNQVCLG